MHWMIIFNYILVFEFIFWLYCACCISKFFNILVFDLVLFIKSSYFRLYATKISEKIHKLKIM